MDPNTENIKNLVDLIINAFKKFSLKDAIIAIARHGIHKAGFLTADFLRLRSTKIELQKALRDAKNDEKKAEPIKKELEPIDKELRIITADIRAFLNDFKGKNLKLAKEKRLGVDYHGLCLFATQHPLDNCTKGFGFLIDFKNSSAWKVASSESLFHILKFALDNRKALAETDPLAAANKGRNFPMIIDSEKWDNHLRYVSMILALVLKMTAYPEVFVLLEEVIVGGQLPCEVQGDFDNVWTLTTGENLLGACLAAAYYLLDLFRSEGIVDIADKIAHIVETFVEDQDLKDHIMSTYGEIVSVKAVKAPVPEKKAPAPKKDSAAPKKAPAPNKKAPAPNKKVPK